MDKRSLIYFQNTDGFLKVGGVIIIYVLLVLYLTLLNYLRCRFFSKERGVNKIGFLDLLFYNIDLTSILTFLLVLLFMSSFYFESDIFMLLLFLVFIYMLPYNSLPESRISGGKIVNYLFSGFLLLIFIIYNILKKYKAVFKGILYFFSFLFFSLSVLLF